MPLEAVSKIDSFLGKKIKVYNESFDNGEMDQEGFLKVLLTSFSYQDPFETQDISKFIDNTVKLRELEIMKKFEDSVSLLSNNNALFLNATNLIGEKVLYKGNVVSIENGKAHVEFIPSENVKQAKLYIYDKQNSVVAEKIFTDLKAGEKYSYDLDKPDLENGYYKVSLGARNGDKDVDIEIYSNAKVIGIEKESGGIVAIIDDKKININEIMKIGG